MTAGQLFGHRLLFVVGKGGVGRTTISLALALEAARGGREVLLVELEGETALGLALAEQRAHPGSPRWVERLAHVAVEGRDALEEYLGLIIPVRRLLKTIFSSRIYQYFVAAAPGLKELMAVGKIWFEVEKKREREPERPRWDLVIVDAPATGHSLQFLRMPKAALDTFPGGLVGREAQRIVGLLQDPVRTGVVVVATAEEMPANETIEMYGGLQDLGLEVCLLVVNQMHEPVCAEADLARLEKAASEDDPAGEAPLLREVIARAREENGWAEVNAANRQRLATGLPVATATLPFVYSEELGPQHVVELAQILGAALGEPAEASPGTAAGRPAAVARGRREGAAGASARPGSTGRRR